MPCVVPRVLFTPRVLFAGTLTALLVAGCATPTAPAGVPAASSSSSSSSAGSAADTSSDVVETTAPSPRLAVSHDQGVWVLDATSLERVGEVPTAGFVRLNPVGDGRHVLVSTGSAFSALDLGTWTEAHGDHGHSYTSAPRLTGAEFPAEEPGHVVHHADRTALFADGSGIVDVFDTDDLAEGKPTTTRWTAPKAHHGVAVPLPRGGLIVSEGDSEQRTGVAVLDAAQRVVARNTDCPGVHGEAMVAGAVVFGCQDGLVVYRDGELSKVDSPDPYGRIGNQAGSENSPVVLGDYKTDPDAELERPQRISLVDTRSNQLRLVELGTSYSFRSLGRGPNGSALVLGTDGNLHVIDPRTARVTARVPVVAPWQEPEQWQSPRPALSVLGDAAYVTEPATRKLHRVDLTGLRVAASVELPGAPNEITGVTG